jgi:hypothetical protein
MIAITGTSTIMYPLRKVVRLLALAWIFQGHVAQPPMTAVKTAPLRISSNLGTRNARSLLVAMELVEIFVPNVARPNARAQKNAAARFVHRLVIEVGSQYRVP